MLFFKGLNKASSRSVIGALYFRREEAAGKFIITQVILHALAALALARAGLIGAGAGLHILFEITFHDGPSGLNVKLQSPNAQ
jgi:hypothetical protein